MAASSDALKHTAVLEVPPAGLFTIPSVAVGGVVAATLRALVSPFAGSNGAPSYFKDVVYAMVRHNLSSLTVPSERKAKAKFSDAEYEDFMKGATLNPKTSVLPSGTRAHWLGDPKAESVLVYFHGGGYVYPISSAHLAFLQSLSTHVNDSSGHRSFGVVILAYSLAPEHPYPAQLRQAAELVNHLIHVEGRHPSSLVLAGDSAGGNLVLSLLSHLLHPHPDPSVPRVTVSPRNSSAPSSSSSPKKDQPPKFRGAFLISPWVSFDVTRKSFQTNSQSDMLTARCLHRWASCFLGQYDPKTDSLKNGLRPAPSDEYSEPLTAPPTWWSGLPDVVDDVLIWGGGGEVLVDSIVDLYWRLKEGFVAGGGKADSVRLALSPRAAHVEMIIDRMLGYSESSPNACSDGHLLKEWVRARL